MSSATYFFRADIPIVDNCSDRRDMSFPTNSARVKIANRNPAWNRCDERAQPETCSAVPEATPHSGGRPLRGKAYHTHPRPVRAIDQRVRTDFVVDVGDVDLRRRPPLQGLGYTAGPDAPCGTVSEFHQMAPIVSFDLHRRSPV